MSEILTRAEKESILRQYKFVLQEIADLEEAADPQKGNHLSLGIRSGRTSDQTANTALARMNYEARVRKKLRFIDQVDAAVDALPYAYVRLAVRYRYLDGKTLEEAADCIGRGYSVSTVKRWASLGIEQLNLDNVERPL